MSQQVVSSKQHSNPSLLHQSHPRTPIESSLSRSLLFTLSLDSLGQPTTALLTLIQLHF